MGATQLLFDFSEPTPPPPKINHAQIIPFPVPPQRTCQVFIPLDFTFAPYGAWVSFGKRLSSSERLRRNNEAIDLLSKQQEQLIPSDLDILRSYSGWGGLSASDERGVLYDYYTSPPIASLAWHLLDMIQPIQKDALILEPSCGTGVFFSTGPQDVFFNGIELDERTASIASILHPDAFISPKSYEAFNLSGNNYSRFDHVIGNVPFGERTLETAFMDMPDEKSLDRYFITRSIDNLKPSGTMAIIAHSGILANKSNAEWRLSISKKAQFMGAVKLNEIVYYLNMQKQRSKYNDTEIFNREHNESFKNYIANHPVYRDELEHKYNRIFNTEIGVPVKTYPVYIEGWRKDVNCVKMSHFWRFCRFSGLS